MKKYLFLGLLLMLLAPLPVSSATKKIAIAISKLDNIPLESYKNLFSFATGTFIGYGDRNSYEIARDYQIDAILEYEFNNIQNPTTLLYFYYSHPLINAADVNVDVFYATHGYNSMIKGDLVRPNNEYFTSEIMAFEVSLDVSLIFVDICDKRYVNIGYLGEGLSVQLRDNYVEYSLFDHGLTYDEWVAFDFYHQLDSRKGPFESNFLEGYSINSMSMCINGFDWSKNKLLLTIVDGDTINDINQYREKRREFSGEDDRPQETIIYDGVDIPLDKPITNLVAKLIDIPDECTEYPFTYKLNSFNNVSIASVDKNFAGELVIQPTVAGDYINERSVSAIENQAMLNRKNITSLSIPQYVSCIGTNALSGMAALEQINVDSENDYFTSADGVLFNKDLTTLIQFPIAKAITQYNVPDETTTIGRDAFYQSKLTSISLPSTLNSIDYDAFGYSKQLKSVTIPSSVKTIGQYAFDHCTSMTTIHILSSIKNLPQYAFNACTALKVVELPNSLQVIDENAFNNCTALADIELPSGLQTIGNNAFNNCAALASIELPAGLQTIGDNAFKGCKKITEIACKFRSPISLPDNAFADEVYNNAVLQVPNGAMPLYKAASGWKNFKNIIEDPIIAFADANVKTICVANWDTNGDAELDLNEAAAVTSLGSAFTGNTTIKLFNELKYFTGLTKIDDNAFKGCKSLQSVIVPANVKQIGKSAFYGDYALTNIVLPEGLEVINDYGIGACTKLAKIELPSTLTTIKTRAFYYDKVLSSINLPASVKSIGTYAFASCPLLMNITANMTSPCAIASNVFTEDTYNNATLTVPYGTYEIYKATNYWSKFANIKTLAGQVSISAAPISIIAGKSGDMVLRLEQNLPSVSFQFDLTLANGITLQSASMIPSSDFVVSTSKVGTYKWRILAYSPTNKPIGGDVGDLMTLILQTEELLSAGTRTAIISGFTLTTLGSNNNLSYITLDEISSSVTVVDAPVTNAGKGDVNLDGIVNVQDIVVLINHIFGSTPNKFSFANADANGDGIINVVDVSTIVLLCMPSSSSNAAPAHAPAASLASMTWDTSNGLSLTIDDATSYVAAQMDVTVDGSLQVNNITAANGHTPVWQQIGENRYRVLVFSNSNDMFSAFGPHLFFDVMGEGEITLSDGLLVDAAGDGFNATASSTGVTTGITTITTELSAPADVYSVSSQLIRRKATSLKNLPAGIYIVNGRKVAVK